MNVHKLLKLFLFIALVNITFADEWHVKKVESNIVKFTSTTTILDFDGTTSDIDGYIYWDGKEIFRGKNELYFEVDLNTVETGIGKRDRDMREDVLETDKWQTTYFKGSIIKAEKDELTNTYKVKVLGKMFIHGIEKEIEIPGNIKIENGIMTVITNFSIYLKDYKIKAPSLLAFIKVAEEIKLHLKFQLEKTKEKNN